VVDRIVRRKDQPRMMHDNYYGRTGLYKEDGTRRLRLHIDSLILFILGLGILVLVLGPCLGIYGLGPGIVGLVISWVVGIPLRVYLLSRTRGDDY
jgi:hypothetical protein